MACVRQRRGRWVLDYRSGGRRFWKRFPLTDEGRQRAEAQLRWMQGGAIDTNPDVKLGDYAREWLGLVRNRVGELTLKKYEIVTRVHLAPLYRVPVADLTRPRLKAFISGLLADGMSKVTALKVLCVVRNILAEAEDEGIIRANPASRIGKRLGLTGYDPEQIRAMDGGQLDAFLTTAKATEQAECFLALLVLAYAGLRLGEMLGLKVVDLGEQLAIERQLLVTGNLTLPKRGKTRRVDVAADLRRSLEASLSDRLRAGRRSPWLLFPELDPEHRRAGGAPKLVRAAMARALEAATTLPLHFTPHCLRHTYASLLLQRGESLIYVSRQLGHASIKMTADLYGRWLPIYASKGGPNLLTTPPASVPPRATAEPGMVVLPFRGR